MHCQTVSILSIPVHAATLNFAANHIVTSARQAAVWKAGSHAPVPVLAPALS